MAEDGNLLSRRGFMSWSGMGLASVALQSMLQEESRAGEERRVGPHFTPKAKSVVWLMMRGGTSHLGSLSHCSSASRENCAPALTVYSLLETVPIVNRPHRPMEVPCEHIVTAASTAAPMMRLPAATGPPEGAAWRQLLSLMASASPWA